MYKKIVIKANNSYDKKYCNKIKYLMLWLGIFGSVVGAVISAVGFYILLKPLITNYTVSNLELNIKSVISMLVFLVGSIIFSICATLVYYSFKIIKK